MVWQHLLWPFRNSCMGSHLECQIYRLILKIYGFWGFRTFKVGRRYLLLSCEFRFLSEPIADLLFHNWLSGYAVFSGQRWARYICLVQSDSPWLLFFKIRQRSLNLGHKIVNHFWTHAFCVAVNWLKELSLLIAVDLIVRHRDFTILRGVACALQTSLIFYLINFWIIVANRDRFRVHELFAGH